MGLATITPRPAASAADQLKQQPTPSPSPSSSHDNQLDALDDDNHHLLYHHDQDDPASPALRGASLQLVLNFLSPRDRLALLATHPTFACEPLATAYASCCARCAACTTSQTPHLCEAPPAEARHASFWTCLLRRSAASGGSLRELRVAGAAAAAAFSNETLAALDAPTRARAFAGLAVLDLTRGEALGPDGLALLADSCTNLHELRVRDTALDARALAALLAANHDTLRVVDLDGCHTLTGADARRLTACRGLVELSLAGCFNVDNAAIAAIVRASPSLKKLNLRFCHKVDDALVQTICDALPQLRALNLRYCMKVTDAGVGVICEKLPLLRALDLSQCSKITDAAVARIVESLRALTDLRLWACSKLTDAAVQAIVLHASTSLEILDIRSRNRVEAVIGGRDGAQQLLVRKRNRASRWEPADEPGVYKRLPSCAVAA